MMTFSITKGVGGFEKKNVLKAWVIRGNRIGGKKSFPLPKKILV